MLLQTLLPPGTNPPPRMCMSGAETRRALGEDDWPLLVINTPLSDESGIDLAIDAASHTATSVLMLVKAELADQVQAQLENYGVFVVAKPVARPLFDQAIRYAAVLRNRLMTVCAEKAKLEKKLADVRVVDRAKCLLIQYRGLTEEQAHRAIESRQWTRGRRVLPSPRRSSIITTNNHLRQTKIRLLLFSTENRLHFAASHAKLQGGEICKGAFLLQSPTVPCTNTKLSFPI